MSIWSGRGTTIYVPINVQAAKKPRNSFHCRKRQPFGSLLKRNRGVLLILRLGRLTSLMRSWKMIANQTDRYTAIMKKKRLKGDEAASVGGLFFMSAFEAAS